MGLGGTGAADLNGVAPLGKEGAAGEIAHKRLVDRRARELEVVAILSERQLGNGELVTDRTRLLLARRSAGRNDTLRFVQVSQTQSSADFVTILRIEFRYTQRAL